MQHENPFRRCSHSRPRTRSGHTTGGDRGSSAGEGVGPCKARTPKADGRSVVFCGVMEDVVNCLVSSFGGERVQEFGLFKELGDTV